MSHWVGIDVGGRRKGFDIAVIDERRLVELQRERDPDAVVMIATAVTPALVAMDSPCCGAGEGAAARDGELALNRAVCGIRWTPHLDRMGGNPYYEWITQGLQLYAAFQAAGVATIEVFPTASWTRWQGPRGTRSRAAWSRAGLAETGLDRLPTRTNQDQRDAIAAAVTARLHSQGATESFGEIVVPAWPS